LSSALLFSLSSAAGVICAAGKKLVCAAYRSTVSLPDLTGDCASYQTYCGSLDGLKVNPDDGSVLKCHNDQTLVKCMSWQSMLTA
jgi:hypothetical protein